MKAGDRQEVERPGQREGIVQRGVDRAPVADDESHRERGERGAVPGGEPTPDPRLDRRRWPPGRRPAHEDANVLEPTRARSGPEARRRESAPRRRADRLRREGRGDGPPLAPDRCGLAAPPEAAEGAGAGALATGEAAPQAPAPGAGLARGLDRDRGARFQSRAPRGQRCPRRRVLPGDTHGGDRPHPGEPSERRPRRERRDRRHAAGAPRDPREERERDRQRRGC